ncbi:probable E3 ubiquitin-protein ligase XBOS34 isoform X1 [Fagus crenata]
MSQKRPTAELLYELVTTGNVEAIKTLCRQGASLEWIDREGKTPLIVACMNHELFDVAKNLIELGANVHAYRPGRHAGTPLHHAAKRGLEQSVKLLLSHGANALVRNDDCQTPLDVARIKGHTNVVRAIENHICYFSGWLREFYGPGFLEALAPQLLSRKIWVVVIPCGSSNSTMARKMELALYPTLQFSHRTALVGFSKLGTELHQYMGGSRAALQLITNITKGPKPKSRQAVMCKTKEKKKEEDSLRKMVLVQRRSGKQGDGKVVVSQPSSKREAGVRFEWFFSLINFQSPKGSSSHINATRKTPTPSMAASGDRLQPAWLLGMVYAIQSLFSCSVPLLLLLLLSIDTNNYDLDAQPRTVIALWKAKIVEPKFQQMDPALTIFDQSTRVGGSIGSTTAKGATDNGSLRSCLPVSSSLSTNESHECSDLVSRPSAPHSTQSKNPPAFLGMDQSIEAIEEKYHPPEPQDRSSELSTPSVTLGVDRSSTLETTHRRYPSIDPE